MTAALTLACNAVLGAVLLVVLAGWAWLIYAVVVLATEPLKVPPLPNHEANDLAGTAPYLARGPRRRGETPEAVRLPRQGGDAR